MTLTISCLFFVVSVLTVLARSFTRIFFAAFDISQETLLVFQIKIINTIDALQTIHQFLVISTIRHHRKALTHILVCLIPSTTLLTLIKIGKSIFTKLYIQWNLSFNTVIIRYVESILASQTFRFFHSRVILTLRDFYNRYTFRICFSPITFDTLFAYSFSLI